MRPDSRTGGSRRDFEDMMLRSAVIALAVAMVLVIVYVVADKLRWALWQQTPWPEVHPQYGSTIWVHVKMVVVLAVVWPLVLHCLGWYRPGRWPRRWLFGQLLAASVLVALSMAAYSMLFDRGIYPRAQIGFTLLLLPGAAALLRMATGAARRERFLGAELRKG